MKMRLERRALDKIYKRRDRYEIPDWQRESVWNRGKKQKLIDTVLRGWRLPKLYLLKISSDPDEYEILDGQQRLTAIWEFLDGDLTLNSQTAHDFGGATYEDLPDHVSDAFDDYELDFDEITDAGEEDQKEFFQRLQEGLPLTSSEKLNAVHSELRDYCEELSNHEFFSESTSVPSRRYAYFDVAAKVMAIELEGFEVGLRFDDVKRVFEDHKAFPKNSAIAKRVRKALDLLNENLPKPCRQIRNRTTLQAFINMSCHLVQVGVPDTRFHDVANFVETFSKELSKQVEMGQQANDHDYLDFQRTVNANVRSGAKTRNTILLRKLFSKYPDLFSCVSSSSAIANGIEFDIESRSTQIAELVYQVNERHAAKHGEDLFKPTNKSTNALAIEISSVSHDIDSYKKVVENLYFLFRESVGQRLGEDTPTSFQHVNELRTLNEHDTDHGKEGKVAKKRKDLATTFETYSGAKTPDALDPASFPLVQANLLGALENDLRSLNKKYAVTQ